MPSLARKMDEAVSTGSGGRLVAADGRELPLRDVQVEARARAGLARVVLTQRFANAGEEPLHAKYSVPLPADGAVSGYAFEIGERRVVGKIEKRAAAREQFEDALLEGRTAALFEQDRANLFQQEIGNVPPGVDVTVKITIDQPLRWVGDGAWEWRFPTVVPPRYLGAPGRVADADRVTVDVLDGPTGARATMELTIGDALASGALPESTSHPIVVERGLTTRIEIGAAAALDRDIVVRWRVAGEKPAIELATGRGATDDVAYALVTVVPPAADALEAAIALDGLSTTARAVLARIERSR